MRRLLIFTMVVICSALQPPSLAPAAESGLDSLDARLTEFITHPYRHGLPPYDIVMSFGPGALPIVRQRLEEPGFAQFRPGMLIMIGYVGGPSETTLLEHYVMDRFEGELEESDLRAVMAALLALGCISDRDPAALAFLKSATNPAHFNKVPFSSSIRGSEGLRLLLSKIAINGIGLSGRKEAEPILLELQLHPYSRNQLGNVWDSLKGHRRLMEVGRSALYGAPINK